MKNGISRRILAWILTVSMLMSLLPMSVLAAEVTVDPEGENETAVVYVADNETAQVPVDGSSESDNEEHNWSEEPTYTETSEDDCYTYTDYYYVCLDEGCDELNWAGQDVVEHHTGGDQVGDDAFYGCSSLTELTIGSGVKEMGLETFQRCTSLTNLTIADGASCIGDFAFAGCSSLTDVTIPSSVTSIGYGAFASSGLTSITIADGVTTIESHTFYNCTSLTSVTIPSSVTYIGANAFYGCNGGAGDSVSGNAEYAGKALEAVYYGGTEAEWESITIEEGNDSLTGAIITYSSHVKSVSLTVGASIGLNFYLALTSAADKVLLNGKEADLEEAEGLYRVTWKTAAKDIDEEVTLEVRDASGNTLPLSNQSADTDGTLTYSVSKYLEAVPEYEQSSESLIALADAMSSYGSAAKAYFDGGSVSYSGDESEINLSDYAATATGTGAGYYGSSLLLKENVTIRHYFTTDPSAVTVSVNGSTEPLEVKQKNGIWYVDIEGIAPAELDTFYTISAGSWSLSYSALSYCYKAMTSGNANLKALVENLYQYYLAAEDYAEALSSSASEAGSDAKASAAA